MGSSGPLGFIMNESLKQEEETRDAPPKHVVVYLCCQSISGPYDTPCAGERRSAMEKSHFTSG